ncbi:MAG TPA: PSD1 and planctomycete cytochrome C domain-containing protein [Pirellulaceae bacterium]|nr:PSD1 and planctomycete cytochrome C domain-containing protein [Pirellulaceae bacterium]
MIARSFVACILFLSLASASTAEESPSRQQIEYFETKIRPVLVKHCYACHSAEAAKTGKLKGGLVLDTRAGVLQGGDSGPALVPHKPSKSLLLSALRYESYEMPPTGELSAEVIRDFKQWIADGAVDPRDGQASVTRSSIDFEQAREFWSLRPLAEPLVPAVKAKTWPRSDIDRFVLARLENEGLEAVGDAALRTLVRRLYFDLIGLPPTPEQIDAFLERAAHDRASAVERLVDELLASPRFGERWGRHWLDVVRYADSNGRDVNVVWYDAWRYRDWVIDALNLDVPFDRFVRQQIAGDLLPAETPEQRDRQRIATGLLAMSPKMIGEQNKEVLRMDTIDEQIDVVSRAFLGLSISCARCHDHKFDPIPTADYYALAGIFKSTEPLYGFGRVGVKNSPHTDLIPAGPQAAALGESGLNYRHQLVERHLEFQQARSARYGVVRRVADAKNRLQRPGADVDKLQADIARMEADVAEWDEKIKTLEDALNQYIAEPPPQPDWAMGVRNAETPVDCRIHIRGETDNLGDAVPRGVLRAVAIDGLDSPAADSSGRVHLANWLAHVSNPLTPRVAVNRIWMHLFGRGLVATVDDFGVTGSPPSHPRLLDYLARTFIDDGWSQKRLIRRIVLSRTYQLASTDAGAANHPQSPLARGTAIDPENILLSRFRPRRLEVEVFRDAAMAVAGQLDRSPPSTPFLNRWNRYEHDKIKSFNPFVTPQALEHSHRSVYLPVLRGSLPEVFELFDFADPNRVVGQREESTAPAQALFLMNSEWIHERASRTADRLLTENHAGDAQRVERLFLLALGRRPTSMELQDALTYVDPSVVEDGKQPQADVPADPEEARLPRWANYCQVVLGSAEFRYMQ